jgi:hypothetical protein
MLRGAEDLLRRPLLEDDAGVEEAHPVGDLARETHLVRGDEHGHARLGELADDLEHLADELGVESARDLVQEHEPGAHRKSPHDRGPLLLAAGEPVGILAGLVRQPEARQQLARLRVGLGPRLPQHLSRRQRDVLEDGHMREEIEGLEDDPDVPPHAVRVHSRRGDLLALDEDAPRGDRLGQVDAPEKRRLSRARGANQADDLVLGEGQVDALQHLGSVEGLAQGFDPKSLTHRAAPRASRLRRSRATSQSVRRASGIVRSTKRSAVTR